MNLVNTFYIWIDKDLALVNGGGRPSPQRDVSTNIFGAFYDMDHDYELKATLKWLEEQNLGEKLGLNISDIKNAYGYIKLGDYVRPPEWASMTDEAIIKELSPYRKIISYAFTVGHNN